MDLKREDRLLLACLTVEDDHGRPSGLQRLSASDWGLVMQRAQKHAVGSLLYQRLKECDPNGLVAPEVFERLRAIYLSTVAKNVRFQHELSKRLKILKDNDIPVIVLKGTHLGEVAYANIGLRGMQDVDILLKKKDLSRAQEMLLEAGYHHHADNFFLDIHWNIDLSVANLNISVEELWARAQPAVIAGVHVLVLSPEDLLLHLCTHLSFHHDPFEFAGLRTLCDIRETVNFYQGDMNWEAVLQRAREWGITNTLYLTLMLALELVGADIPENVLTALRPIDFSPQIRDWALSQMFEQPDSGFQRSPRFWLVWKPGPFREKMFHILKLVFPAPEFISQKYPAPCGSAKNYLYYLVRLKDHYGRYAHVAWRILKGDEQMASVIKRQNQNIAMREWLSSN